MCFKNVSWLYSGLKELSSVASSFVSFMSIVILSSHCDALDPKASTPIKNPGFARVHPGRHDTRFRRVEAPTSACWLTPLCAEFLGIKVIWGRRGCFRFIYASRHLLLQVHILAKVHKCLQLQYFPDLERELWILKKCWNHIRKVNAE